LQGHLKFDDLAFIAGSSKYSTNKPLSLLLNKILTAAKEKFQMYCAITYARNGINQMSILKNSKELLTNLKAQNFSQINIVIASKCMTFRPFTLSIIPHEKLRYSLFDIIDNCFLNKNGKRK
jgi:hypothetical protein